MSSGLLPVALSNADGSCCVWCTLSGWLGISARYTQKATPRHMARSPRKATTTRLYFGCPVFCTPLLANFRVVELFRVLLANFADEDEVIAGGVRTVFVVAGLASTVNALANYFRVVTKVHAHAAIKDIELALP